MMGCKPVYQGMAQQDSGSDVPLFCDLHMHTNIATNKMGGFFLLVFRLNLLKMKNYEMLPYWTIFGHWNQIYDGFVFFFRFKVACDVYFMTIVILSPWL